MAIADQRLKQFFSKQKIGDFDALKQKDSASKKNKLPNLVVSPKNKPSLPLKNSNHNPSVNDPLTIQKQPVSDPLAIQKQPVSNPLAHSLASNHKNFMYFSKKEQELLTVIFQECASYCSLESRPISTDEIRQNLKISPERLRNLISRITKKGGVRILQHKSGKSAFRVFEFSKELYESISKIKIKLPQHSLADPLAKHPLSSSSNYYITTTTNEPDDLTQKWMEIDISPLQEWGFTHNHLLQIKSRTSLSPDIVQDSINFFHFDLTRNEKAKTIKKTPLDFFMGLLAKGHPYVPPENYISAQEEALQKFLERKRIEQQKREDMGNELVSCAFNEKWLPSLSTSEKSKILGPLGTAKFNGGKVELSILLSHFKEHVWPSMKEEYLNEPLIL